MIEFLKSWVLNIVTLAILIVLLEILVPSGKLKKFVNLVSGFILIIAIINPVLGLFESGQYKIDFDTQSSFYLDKKSIEENSRVMNERQLKLTVDLYRERLIKEIEKRAGEISGNYTVKADVIINEDSGTELFGQIKKVYLTLGETDERKNIKPVNGIERIKVEKIGDTAGEGEDKVENSGKVDEKTAERLKESISNYLSIKKDDIVITLKE